MLVERNERGRDGWRETSVEEIAQKIAMGPFGSDITTDNFVPSGVPVIRGGNLTAGRFRAENFVFLTDEKAGRLAGANAYPGDVVFTHRGTLGQVGLIPDTPFQRYVISQSQMKLTCRTSEADPAFLYYFFKSPLGQRALLMNTSQTGVPAISRPVSSLKSIRLSLPPFPEQRAIAHILGTLDDKIELNRRMNETLESMARTLFKSWFVDFDPVHAKAALKRHAANPIPRQGNSTQATKAAPSDHSPLEGEPVGGNQTPLLLPKGGDWTVERARAYLDGMEPEIATLFPDSFAASESGRMIPKGWQETTLNGIALLNPEAWTARNAPETIVYVDLSNTKWGTIGKYETHEWQDAPSRAKRVLRTGDTILGTVRPGNGSYAFIGRDGLTGSTGFAVLRPILPRDRAMVWGYATAPENIRRLAHLADGAAYPAVRPQVVSATEVTLPSGRIRDAFGKVCGPLLDRMEANQHESRALASLRDTLLPELVSGRTRIPRAELQGSS